MTKFLPLVSIVIPIYNGSNYMIEAIDSALNQTYPNIEIIVVNDGSNDDGATEKIAKSYGKKIKYFAQTNGGVASALNCAIDEMKGDYFSWLSHDDAYLPEKIAHQIKTLDSLEDKETILYSSYEVIDAKSNKICVVDPASQLTQEQLNTPLIPLFRGLIHGCSMLISSKWFADIGKFDEKLKSTQDYRLWYDFLTNAQIHFCNIPLIQSRSHEDQGSKKIVNVNQEANNLWIELLSIISEEKMIETEGSRYAFFRRAEIFLNNSPYSIAAKFAKQKAKESFGESLVSIIIPVYNRVNLAIKSINSALEQSYANVEIIVINDGSTEDVSSLEALAQENSKIKYFLQKNKGASTARNLGITKSKGDYIAFLDADDMFLPSKIELQIKKMVDDDSYISHTAYNRIDKNGNKLQEITSDLMQKDVFDKIIFYCTIATPTVLLRKSLLDNNKFVENMHVGEDTCLWIDLVFKWKRLSYIGTPCANILFYEETTVNNPEKYFKGHINIINHLVVTKPFEYYKHNIKKLLLLAHGVLPTTEEKTTPNKLSFLKTFIKKIYYFYKEWGLVETVRKIFRTIKN